MEDSKEILKKYINRILELQDSQDQGLNLSDQELKKVASDLGLNEEAWALIQKEFEDHKHRGIGFAKYENWEDATKEYEEARILRPENHEILALLQVAYEAWWKQSSKGEYKEKALMYARKILEKDPSDDQALKFISESKKSSLPKGSPSPNSPKGYLLTILGILIASGMVFLLFSIFPQTEMNANQKKDSLASPSQPVEPPNLSQTEEPAKQKPLFQTFGKAQFLNVPIELALENVNELMTFLPQKSDIKIFSDSYSYQANGYWVINKVEVEEMQATVSLIDAEGQVFYKENFHLRRDHEPTAWPGEMIPWRVHIYQKVRPEKEIVKVLFEPFNLQLQPAQKDYPTPTRIENVKWKGDAPQDHLLRFNERLIDVRETAVLKKGYATIELLVSNEGKAPYQKLKIRINWHGGGKTESSEMWIVGPDQPTFRPNTTLLDGGTYEVPLDLALEYEGYDIEIIEWN